MKAEKSSSKNAKHDPVPDRRLSQWVSIQAALSVSFVNIPKQTPHLTSSINERSGETCSAIQLTTMASTSMIAEYLDHNISTSTGK